MKIVKFTSFDRRYKRPICLTVDGTRCVINRDIKTVISDELHDMIKDSMWYICKVWKVNADFYSYPWGE